MYSYIARVVYRLCNVSVLSCVSFRQFGALTALRHEVSNFVLGNFHGETSLCFFRLVVNDELML